MSFYLYSINTGFYIKSDGYVGILNSNPQHALDISGSLRTERLIGNNNSMNYAFTVGGSPHNPPESTVTVEGNDMAGKISITVRNGEGGASFVLTVNFNKPYSQPPYVIFSNRNGVYNAPNANHFKLNTVTENYFSFLKDIYNAQYNNFWQEDQTYIWDYIVVGR